MTDSQFPPRLSECAGDELLQAVLTAGDDDALGPSGIARVLATFEASKAAPRDAGGGGPVAADGSFWTLRTKVLLASVGLVCAAAMASRAYLSAAGSVATSSPTPPGADAPPRAAVGVGGPSNALEPAARSSALPPEPPSDVSTTRLDDLPSAAAPATRARTTAPAATTAAPASSFTEELALVEAARASLKSGDVRGCLRVLDDYDRRYRGVFADEIVVMRVEALIAAGERERARELGEAFLAKHAGSPYGRRVQSLVVTTH